MSDAPRPPRKPEIRPGENIWLALAREVVTNPDSPASLQLLSKVNEAMRPRTRAGDQLTEALADQIERPDDAAAQAAVDAAIAHWAKACGSTMDPELLDLFREDATALAARRRRQPPALEAIVAGTHDRSDVGYRLGVHLEGLRGTWHRLWALIALTFSFGSDPATAEAVTTVRQQFEQSLGRELTPEEWKLLVDHARRHAETHMRG